MSALGNAKIFGRNLRRYIDQSGKLDKEVAEAVGVSTATMSEWLNGKKYPRINRIELLARYFGIQKSDLIEDSSEDTMSRMTRLLTADNAERLEAMHQNPKLGLLFDRTRKMSSADVEMMLALSERITGENDK